VPETGVALVECASSNYTDDSDFATQNPAAGHRVDDHNWHYGPIAWGGWIDGDLVVTTSNLCYFRTASSGRESWINSCYIKWTWGLAVQQELFGRLWNEDNQTTVAQSTKDADDYNYGTFYATDQDHPKWIDSTSLITGDYYHWAWHFAIYVLFDGFRYHLTFPGGANLTTRHFYCITDCYWSA
jgi:hypothetical protein